MSEKDAGKGCLSGCLALWAFGFGPVLGLVVGLVTWNWRYGLLAGFLGFCIPLALATIVLSTIKEPGLFLTWAPFVTGVLDTILPDAFPLPFDDAAAMAAGAIATFGLWLKRQQDVPKTAVLPLLIGAVYTLVGGFIPGPVDELFVNALGIGAAVWLGQNVQKRLAPPPAVTLAPPVDDDTLL
jgi:hypothetical protein